MEARRPIGEIAERLGRHPSTIYRELGRNRFRDGDRGFCGYFPLNAQDMARRRRQRGRKLAADEGLRAHVTERLKAGRSPQQIAGRLKRDEADGGPTVCHETIYRHVYGPEGREDRLYRHLPKARRRRGNRYGRRPRSAAIPRERWIENRPAEVNGRESFGHWEADLLIFRKEHGKANVTSPMERTSRFIFLLANGTPRFLSSFMTRSQNLAPSFCSSHRPRTSLVPSARTPKATWTALFLTRPSSRTLTLSASKKTKG